MSVLFTGSTGVKFVNAQKVIVLIVLVVTNSTSMVSISIILGITVKADT